MHPTCSLKPGCDSTLSTGMYSTRLTRPKPGNKKVKDFKEYAKLYLELALCFTRVTRVMEVINNLKGLPIYYSILAGRN